MKITKIGHSCFVTEPKEGVRVMTDPGAFSPLASEVKNISAILITHEHSDHLHKDAIDYAKELKPKVVFPVHDAILQDWATFVSATSEKLLKEAGIEFKKLELGKEEEF